MDVVAEVLAGQAGVVGRRQLLGLGLGPGDIERLVRRRDLTRTHPGVYIDHTGPPSWLQRAWSAVLFSWPSALTHESALRIVDGPGRHHREATIHVAVTRGRRLVAPAGVRIHRVADLDVRALWHLGPPRIRYEHAVLDVAGGATRELDAIAVLADACGSRRSTAQRLLETLAARPRQAQRALVRDVLHDVASGTCSVLEHAYLVGVERAHGLPVGVRQSSHRQAGTLALRDVEYPAARVVVELDGRLFHDSSTRRDADMDRDLDAAASDDAITLRLSWGEGLDRPCRTAGRVATLLQRRGWTGAPRPCEKCG